MIFVIFSRLIRLHKTINSLLLQKLIQMSNLQNSHTHTHKHARMIPKSALSLYICPH